MVCRTVLMFSSLLAIAASRSVYTSSSREVDESLGLIGGGYAINQLKSTGDCAWFGEDKALSHCSGTCPAGYNLVRSSKTGNLTNSQENNFLDPTFGDSCRNGRKALCCRPDSSDCTWRGTWSDSLNRHWSCSYRIGGYTAEELQDFFNTYGSMPNCGILKCAMISTWEKTTLKARTSGYKCTEFEMNGMHAEAYCGVIYFYKNKDDNIAVDRWFKI